MFGSLLIAFTTLFLMITIGISAAIYKNENRNQPEINKAEVILPCKCN